MSRFASIPNQQVASLDNVDVLEVRRVPTGEQWTIDLAVSTISDETRFSITTTENDTITGDVEIILNLEQLVELKARLAVAHERHIARIKGAEA